MLWGFCPVILRQGFPPSVSRRAWGDAQGASLALGHVGIRVTDGRKGTRKKKFKKYKELDRRGNRKFTVCLLPRTLGLDAFRFVAVRRNDWLVLFRFPSFGVADAAVFFDHSTALH